MIFPDELIVSREIIVFIVLLVRSIEL